MDLLKYLIPSNNRDWAEGFEKLAEADINGNLVIVKNIQDFRYQGDKLISKSYLCKL